MNEIIKKKRGRPQGYKVDNPMDKAMPKVMLTSEQLEAYKTASEGEGKTFSAWVRGALDKASK